MVNCNDAIDLKLRLSNKFHDIVFLDYNLFYWATIKNNFYSLLTK